MSDTSVHIWQHVRGLWLMLVLLMSYCPCCFKERINSAFSVWYSSFKASVGFFSSEWQNSSPSTFILHQKTIKYLQWCYKDNQSSDMFLYSSGTETMWVWVMYFLFLSTLRANASTKIAAVKRFRFGSSQPENVSSLNAPQIASNLKFWHHYIMPHWCRVLTL